MDEVIKYDEAQYRQQELRWTTLSRPQLSTCNSFHFQSLVVTVSGVAVTLQEQ